MGDKDMAYAVIPGIRQDHRGRRYFQAVYPNGKLIQIFALAHDELSALEPARTIPIVEPRVAARRVKERT